MSQEKINSYGLLNNATNVYTDLKLLQTSSRAVLENKGEPGKLFHTLTEKNYDSIELLFLAVRNEFRVWKEGDGLARYPEWFSNDMENLVHLNPDKGEVIETVPLKSSPQWLNRKYNSKAKTQFNFLALLSENSQLVSLKVGGLSYKYAKHFLEKARSTGKQLYEFMTRVGVGQEDSQYGKKFILNFQITDQKIPQNWNERAPKLCQQFIESTQNFLVSPQ